MSIIRLDIPEVPVREKRLGTITGFEGTAAELVRCSGCGGPKERNRSFSQCLGCGNGQAATTTLLIQDAAVISHGPVGCSACLHEFNFVYKINADRRKIEHPTQRHVYSTNLEEKDTIYGGINKLKNAIDEVYERVHPKAIFILTTCAAGIIGDDVESVANEASKRIGIPVGAVFCEGFRSKVWTSGFDAAYHAVARTLIKPAETKRKMINVINFWGTDIFTDWFREFGYEPNYITPYATVDSLAHASEAAATVQICSTLGSYMGAVLEQEFGVREIRTSPPFGIAQTDRWFRELGQILGQEEKAEEILQRKKEEYLPKIEELREKLRGKKAYVAAGAAHGHSLLAILKEYGMETVGAAIFHHDPVYDNEAPEADTLRHVVEDYGDVPNYNVCNKQEFELVNILTRVHPDILLARHGGMTLWGGKNGIPSLVIDDEQYGMGYEGLVRYGERMVETIENNEFALNLKAHAHNPYTKWWLQQDPYTFLQKPKKAKGA